MTTYTSDPSTNNVDADNPPQSSAPSRLSDNLEVDPAETKLVEQWHRDIKISRTFDDAVRKLFAMDRRYARADTNSVVQHSLIQAYIDILVAFLVARDPDFDCLPSDRMSSDEEMKLAEEYGETMSVVVSYLLRSARLKRIASKVVRGALSVGIGWIKAVWYEQRETDPNISSQIKTAQDNIAALVAKRRCIAEGEYADLDLELAEMRLMEKALNEKLEKVVAHGMSLAMIRPEDMTVSIEVENVIDVQESEWMSDRYFIHKDKAEAQFPRVPIPMIQSAAKYGPRKPEDRKNRQQVGALKEFTDTDADQFTVGGTGDGTNSYLCAYEVWDSNVSQFFTVLEGVNDRYAREPSPPPAPTTRFMPYFAVSFTEIDGERYPQSLIQRSYKLQDEIDRTLNQMVEHRRRTKPQTLFDAAAVDKATVKRVSTQAITAEYVPVKMVGSPDKRDIRRAFFPKQYAAIDPALYDIALYIRCMETIWGIQEALTGTVQVAKTATEAEIQQAGTQAKSGYKRDILENVFTDLGNYTAEISAYRLERADVVTIAGTNSIWVEIESVDEMQAMLSIDVRAGSSGKPDSAARRDAWLAMNAAMEKLIMAIADLRQSDPLDIAQRLEALMVELGDRLGERIDIKQFIPQAPAQPIINPMTGKPATNSELGALQQAAAASAQASAPPPGGGGPKNPGETGGGEAAAQDAVAPQDAPA